MTPEPGRTQQTQVEPDIPPEVTGIDGKTYEREPEPREDHSPEDPTDGPDIPGGPMAPEPIPPVWMRRRKSLTAIDIDFVEMTASDLQGRELLYCQRCHGVVLDKAKHVDWHDTFNRHLEILYKAIEALEEAASQPATL